MTPELIAAEVIRFAAFAAWISFSRIYWNGGPVPLIARRMIMITIIFGLGCFVVGGFAVMKLIPGPVANGLYTIFAGFALCIALALHMSSLRDETED